MVLIRKITEMGEHYYLGNNRIAFVFRKNGMYWIEGSDNLSKKQFKKKLKEKVLEMNKGVMPKIQTLDLRMGIK